MILLHGFAAERPAFYFNVSYAWIVAWLFLLEAHMPYRAEWRHADGQLRPDLSHTILTKGLVQLLIVSILSFGVLSARSDTLLGATPLPLQVAIGLIVSELGLYWAHRLAHDLPLIWRFHAIHHSVRKLWLVNTGRFHFVDSFLSVFASFPLLLLAGVSMDAIIWVSAITAYIGILTHCNVDMCCGSINYVFNTPNLHRWHHSTCSEEGNNNYGENLMLWDMVFGTFFYRPRADVGVIGIKEYMPADFTGQLYAPFVWRRYQASQPAATADSRRLR